MLQPILTGAGAGVASAVLFALAAKGNPAASLIALFASLPIMIAGLGFGSMVALGAVGVGALAIALGLHWMYGLVFLVSLALPAWWLSRVTMLARPLDATAGSAEPVLVWYPLSRILGWIAAVAAATGIALIFVLMMRFGSYNEAVNEAASRLAPMLQRVISASGLPSQISAQDFAVYIVVAMPVILAGWGVLVFSANLWLAGRVVKISGLLTRPWPDVAQELRMPSQGATIFALALLACFFDGLPRAMGAAIAAALLIAYALQGFATLHVMTRGNAQRGALLGLTYGLCLMLMPWPLALAAMLGLADSFFDLRNRRGKAPTESA